MAIYSTVINYPLFHEKKNVQGPQGARKIKFRVLSSEIADFITAECVCFILQLRVQLEHGC